MGTLSLPRAVTFPRVFLAVLLALTAFLSLRDFYSYQFGFTPDSVEYVLLAKGLAQGQPYALNFASFSSESTQYPFGFPALLIPFVLVAPRGFESAAVLSLAATLSSVALLFLGWRSLVPEVDERWRYPVSAMFALSPTTVMQTRLVLSDAPFTLMFLLALFFAVRVLRRPELRSGWVHLGVACFFLVFVRSIGLVCLAALLFYMAVMLRTRLLRGIVWTGATFALLVGLVLALTPVKVSDMIPSDYVNWYLAFGPLNRGFTGADAGERPPDETTETETTETAITGGPEPQQKLEFDSDYLSEHLTRDLRRLVLLTGGGEWEGNLANRLGLPWLVYVPPVAMLALIGIGAVNWIWKAHMRGLPLLSVFMLVGGAYAVVVFLWRGGGERIWLPVQPHLYLTFLLGIAVLAQSVAALAARVVSRGGAARAARVTQVGLGAGGVVVLVWLGLAAYRDLTLPTSMQMWGDLHSRAEIFDPYIEKDAVVMSDFPAYDALYGGRETISITYMPRDAQLLEALERYQVRYVVLAVDEGIERQGNARRRNRVRMFWSQLHELAARGVLTPIYQNSYPLTIWRVGAATQ